MRKGLINWEQICWSVEFFGIICLPHSFLFVWVFFFCLINFLLISYFNVVLSSCTCFLYNLKVFPGKILLKRRKSFPYCRKWFYCKFLYEKGRVHCESFLKSKNIKFEFIVKFTMITLWMTYSRDWKGFFFDEFCWDSRNFKSGPEAIRIGFLYFV